MSEYQTVARPYAQAVFELAQTAGEFPAWSDALALSAIVAADSRVQDLAQNPRVARGSVAQLFEDVGGDLLFDQARNFVRLVIENGRIFALPLIATQYETMRAEAEGTIEAELVSAREISPDQQTNIAKSLSKRLGREVNLRVTEKPELIGGAVLRAGDLVIDASVKGRLEKLAATLAR